MRSAGDRVWLKVRRVMASSIRLLARTLRAELHHDATQSRLALAFANHFQFPRLVLGSPVDMMLGDTPPTHPVGGPEGRRTAPLPVVVPSVILLRLMTAAKYSTASPI